MFTINSRDIFKFRTPGGDRFTEFVDALIRAEAYSQGIPMSGIATNLRTNLGDGGVDSEVCQAIPTSQTGWFSVPTCWQYKATQFKGIYDANWYQKIDEIAQQFCQKPELLISEMKWLGSPEAISSWALGNALGKYDTQAVCLEPIISGATNTSATDLAREYIGSLVINYPQHIALVNNWIDQLETQVPKVAYELFLAGGHATKAVERTLNLIDKAVLPLAYLDKFSLMIAKHQLSAEDFGEILKPLIQSVKEEENISAIETAIKLVSHQLYSGDVKAHKKKEVEDAKKFLHHPPAKNKGMGII